MPSSRGSSQPRNQTGVSCIAGRFFNHLEPPGKHTKGEQTEEKLGILKGQGSRATRPDISSPQPVRVAMTVDKVTGRSWGCYE